MPLVQTSTSRLAALAGEEFDLIVVGGGIIGAGIARDAALRGLRVALFEKSDFGGGTTAGSTRLIHGGLRYLEMLDFFEFAGIEETMTRQRLVITQQIIKRHAEFHLATV